MSIAESLKVLVGKDGPHTSSVPIPREVEKTFVARDSPPPPQHAIYSAEGDDLAEIFDHSVDDVSEGGSVSHLAEEEASGPNRWYLLKDNWNPFWDDDGKVIGFMVGNSRVPGSFEFDESSTGIRWRYSQAKSLPAVDESMSDHLNFFFGL